MPFPTMHKNDVANVAKEVELERKEIYDDIVFDYSAIKPMYLVKSIWIPSSSKQ